MNIIETQLAGVFILEPQVFKDDRGFFFESYNQKTFKDLGIEVDFVQDNQSFSTYGTIRGLHAQTGEHAQAKLVRVVSGKVLDVAVDVNKDSPTYGKHVAIELSAENKRQLFIPRGYLHGFSVLSETAMFFYKCDNFYNKASETGVLYNSQSLNIDWKIAPDKAVISEKDMILAEFK